MGCSLHFPVRSLRPHSLRWSLSAPPHPLEDFAELSPARGACGRALELGTGDTDGATLAWQCYLGKSEMASPFQSFGGPDSEVGMGKMDITFLRGSCSVHVRRLKRAKERRLRGFQQQCLPRHHWPGRGVAQWRRTPCGLGQLEREDSRDTKPLLVRPAALPLPTLVLICSAG